MTAPDLALRLLILARDARRASLSRSWLGIVATHQACWQGALRRVLHRGGVDSSCRVPMLRDMFAIFAHVPSSADAMFQFIQLPCFKRFTWSVAIKQIYICAKPDESDGISSSALQSLTPAFAAFAVDLLRGVDVTWCKGLLAKGGGCLENYICLGGIPGKQARISFTPHSFSRPDRIIFGVDSSQAYVIFGADGLAACANESLSSRLQGAVGVLQDKLGDARIVDVDFQHKWSCRAIASDGPGRPCRRHEILWEDCPDCQVSCRAMAMLEACQRCTFHLEGVADDHGRDLTEVTLSIEGHVLPFAGSSLDHAIDLDCVGLRDGDSRIDHAPIASIGAQEEFECGDLVKFKHRGLDGLRRIVSGIVVGIKSNGLLKLCMQPVDSNPRWPCCIEPASKCALHSRCASNDERARRFRICGKVCSFCATPGAVVKLQYCPCRTVEYCSDDCQRQHWHQHKSKCTKRALS
eukprot:gnl/TRDRNA2_/TRDRNA2_67564_c0_seq1.p1 gnl/TRDRNA2_/TRDRNA2_67564_c0~~gnl/TRDRNA2_/TRDRNA2_67564_c0_seq1.p1  ORF type:complete len:500 (-),score=21.96 gnl/TRDRNA2_/TRDRNA2_67564_c0_seq1:17-1414(-)